MHLKKTNTTYGTTGSIQGRASSVVSPSAPLASNRGITSSPKTKANIWANAFYIFFTLSSLTILMWLAANQGVNAYKRGYDAAIPDATDDYQTPGVKPHFGARLISDTGLVISAMMLAFFVSMIFKGISALFIIKCADKWESRGSKIFWQVLGALLPIADLGTIKLSELFANLAVYDVGYDNSYLFTYFKLCNNHTLINCDSYPLPPFANSTGDFTDLAPLNEIELSQALPTNGALALVAGLSLGAGIAGVFCCAKGGFLKTRRDVGSYATDTTPLNTDESIELP